MHYLTHTALAVALSVASSSVALPAHAQNAFTAPATSTATSSPITSPLVALSSTATPGNVYLYAYRPPLRPEETAAILGIAALSALVGALFVQKRLIERSFGGVSSLTLRSAGRAQPQRQ